MQFAGTNKWVIESLCWNQSKSKKEWQSRPTSWKIADTVMDWHIFPFYFLESEKYSEQYYAIHRPTIITQISPLGGSQFCLAFSLASDPVPLQIESSTLNHSSDRLLDLGWLLSRNGWTARTGEGLTSPWMDFAYNCLALSTAFA